MTARGRPQSAWSAAATGRPGMRCSASCTRRRTPRRPHCTILGPPLRSAAGHAPSPETSPASSQTPDLLLCVADLPRLQAADVAALCRAWRADPQRPFDALRPVVDGRPGHPVLLSARAVRVLAAAPPETGLREALQAAGLRLSLLALDSPGPVTDLDTPDDLQALRAAWPQADIRWPDDGFPPCAP
ncbi:MAG: hypothetical protein RL223_1269 [Pseudomonadota bacterium]